MTTYAIQPAMYNVTAMNCKHIERFSYKKSLYVLTIHDLTTIALTSFIAGMFTGFAWWCMV
jgi:hypothetical protein